MFRVERCHVHSAKVSERTWPDCAVWSGHIFNCAFSQELIALVMAYLKGKRDAFSL